MATSGELISVKFDSVNITAERTNLAQWLVRAIRTLLVVQCTHKPNESPMIHFGTDFSLLQPLDLQLSNLTQRTNMVRRWIWVVDLRAQSVHHPLGFGAHIVQAFSSPFILLLSFSHPSLILLSVFHAPLAVRSIKHSHQSPEWTILSHVNASSRERLLDLRSCWIALST